MKILTLEFLIQFIATYSTGFAVSCKKCSAGYKCPNRTRIELCPFDKSNGFTYSTDNGRNFY